MENKWKYTINRAITIWKLEYSESLVNDIFDEITKSYSNNRFYHNLDHIENLLESLSDFNLSAEDKTKLELAIWFHDIIYDPKETDNEFKAALEFEKFGLLLGMKNSLITEISELIIITKHTDKPNTHLEKIMCDVDLKGLGTFEYLINATNVRKEFLYLSDEEWIDGRFEFLISMLNKKSIFHTSEYKELYEHKANINLQNELLILK